MLTSNMCKLHFGFTDSFSEGNVPLWKTVVSTSEASLFPTLEPCCGFLHSTSYQRQKAEKDAIVGLICAAWSSNPKWPISGSRWTRPAKPASASTWLTQLRTDLIWNKSIRWRFNSFSFLIWKCSPLKFEGRYLFQLVDSCLLTNLDREKRNIPITYITIGSICDTVYLPTDFYLLWTWNHWCR